MTKIDRLLVTIADLEADGLDVTPDRLGAALDMRPTAARLLLLRAATKRFIGSGNVLTYRALERLDWLARKRHMLRETANYLRADDPRTTAGR